MARSVTVQIVRTRQVQVTVSRPGATGQGVPTGGATGQVLAKKSSANYDTEWMDAAAGTSGVSSIFGRTGAVTAQTGDYTAAQVGADATGTASSVIAAHVALPDPHTQYAKESELGDAASKNVGTTAGTVAAGNDSRLSDARTPLSHSHAISDVTNLQTSLDGKLGSTAQAADVNPAGTAIASALAGKAASSHSHNVATTGAAGFMSAADKTKLDGLSNYTLPTASSSTLGGIKLGGGLSIDGNGVVTASGGMENPMTTAADIIVGGASGAPARLAKGTALQVLRMNADASAQEWATVSSGGAGQLVVPMVPPNAAVTMTNQGQTLVFLGLDSRYTYKLDLSSYTQCRMTARVATNSASANTPQLRVLYKTSTLSTTIGDYSDIGTSSIVCSLAATGLIDSGWINLAAGAKADVFVTVGQEGGDGAADPAVQLVALHFK